jgi:hypothetical protein
MGDLADPPDETALLELIGTALDVFFASMKISPLPMSFSRQLPFTFSASTFRFREVTFISRGVRSIEYLKERSFGVRTAWKICG